MNCLNGGPRRLGGMAINYVGRGGSVGTWAEGGCAGRVGSLPRYLCRNLILYANFLTIRVSLLNMQTTNSNRNLTNPTTSSFNVGSETVSQAKQTLTTTLTADRPCCLRFSSLGTQYPYPPRVFSNNSSQRGARSALPFERCGEEARALRPHNIDRYIS